jgi:hypothetical protein
MGMWSKIVFRFYGDEKKFEMVKDNGIIIGSRQRMDRKVYLYMLKDFFVEVMYINDDIDMQPERIDTFSSLDHLHTYLEKDFRAAF